MTLRAAFLFIAPQADPVCHRSVITTPQVELITVGVKNYSEGVQAAKDLVRDGVGAIELCAGFGTEGVAMIKKAVDGKAVVGVVRFDHHPGLGFKSGDELFL